MTTATRKKQNQEAQYQRLYNDILSEGLMFAYQWAHHRIFNKKSLRNINVPPGAKFKRFDESAILFVCFV